MDDVTLDYGHDDYLVGGWAIPLKNDVSVILRHMLIAILQMQMMIVIYCDGDDDDDDGDGDADGAMTSTTRNSSPEPNILAPVTMPTSSKYSGGPGFLLFA